MIEKLGKVNEAIYYMGLYSGFNLSKVESEFNFNIIRYEGLVNLDRESINKEFVRTFNDSFYFIKRNIMVSETRLKKFMLCMNEALCFASEKVKEKELFSTQLNKTFKEIFYSSVKSLNSYYNEGELEKRLNKSLEELKDTQVDVVKTKEIEEVKEVETKEVKTKKDTDDKDIEKSKLLSFFDGLGMDLCKDIDKTVRQAFEKMIRAQDKNYLCTEFTYNNNVGSEYSNEKVSIGNTDYKSLGMAKDLKLTYIKDKSDNLLVIGNTNKGMFCGYTSCEDIKGLKPVKVLDDIESTEIRSCFNFYYNRLFKIAEGSNISAESILKFKELQNKKDMDINNRKVVIVHGYDGINELYLLDKCGNNLVGKIENSEFREFNSNRNNMSDLDNMLFDRHTELMQDGAYIKKQLSIDDDTEVYEIDKERLEAKEEMAYEIDFDKAKKLGGTVIEIDGHKGLVVEFKKSSGKNKGIAYGILLESNEVILTYVDIDGYRLEIPKILNSMNSVNNELNWGDREAWRCNIIWQCDQSLIIVRGNTNNKLKPLNINLNNPKLAELVLRLNETDDRDWTRSVYKVRLPKRGFNVSFNMNNKYVNMKLIDEQGKMEVVDSNLINKGVYDKLSDITYKIISALNYNKVTDYNTILSMYKTDFSTIDKVYIKGE